MQTMETGNYYYGARYNNPSTSVWLSVDPKAYAFPNVSPYTFNMNNPVMMIDPGGDSTFFYDVNGNHLYTSSDGLDNAIVVIDAEGRRGYDNIVAGIRSGDYCDSDEMWQNARDHGISYMVDEYFDFYDQNADNAYTGEGYDILPGEPPLIKEAATQLILNDNNELRIGGDQDLDGTPGIYTLGYGNADAKLHTHPNEGRSYFNREGFRETFGTGVGSMGLDRQNSRQVAGSAIFDIVVTKSQVRLFNKSSVPIIYNR